MEKKMLPLDIFNYLSQKVLGQDAVLKQIAVSVYKHINGIKWGNIFIIGNSGTGKTTIMKSIRQLYNDHNKLSQYKAMAIMNANTLVDEDGEVNINRVFKNVEADVRNLLGSNITVKKLKAYMENATVCFDEIDKISSRISGRVNVTGITIQQAVLTILEGETIFFETKIVEDGKQKIIKIPIDTSKMLFICGGAFEELYDQVYALVAGEKDERELKTETRWDEATGRLEKEIYFNLNAYLKLSDLYAYGMVPQFISRFSAIAVLEDLKKDDLKKILSSAEDSPYLNSKDFFKTFGIQLRLSEEALDLIASHAEENPRIGARALREVFSRLISDFQYDPFGSDKLVKKDEKMQIRIDKATATQYL